MKRLLFVLFICSLLLVGVSTPSRARRDGDQGRAVQSQSSAASASSAISSAQAGDANASPAKAGTMRQPQNEQQAADANSAEAGKEMNSSSLPQAPPTSLRVEDEGEESDEPLSDIDPETLRELKRTSSAPSDAETQIPSSFNRSAKEDDAPAKPAPLAPNLIQNFAGVNDSDQLDGFIHTPPDTNMAAGPNHVVVVVNALVATYSKTGTLLSKSSLSSWFSNLQLSACATCSIFDPRITYDSGASHWVIVALYKDSTSQSKVLLSISQTSDATGGWWNYALDGVLNYSGETTWADYPDVGFDGIASASGGAVYVTVNQFTFSSSSFKTALLYILPKSGLYAGGSVSYWRAFDKKNGDNTQAFTYRASKTYGNPGGEFLVNTENNGSSVSLWRVNPTYPPTAVDWTLQNTVGIGAYSIAPDATQPGTTDLIDTMDNRMFNAVWRNGRIYAAFTEAHNWGSGTVAAFRYLKINTSSNAAEVNETFGADTLHYFCPAIAPDSSDNIVLVFSRSNASEFAGARYTGRLTTDSTAQGSAALKSGTATLFKRSSTNSNRWGDYQGAAVDPSDESKVWIYGEWTVDLAGINNDYDWGTWIGQVQFSGGVSAPTAPTASAATGTAGGSFTANWGSSSGATGYRLDVSTSNLFGSFVSGYQDLDVGNTLSRNVTGLSANTTYFYRVRAYNSAGTSGNSNTISVTTTSATSGLVINATFDSSVTNSANSAAIQTMINQAIATYQSLFKDPITVSILFRYSTTGPDGSPLSSGTLAQSTSVIYTNAWSTYINALKADAKTSNDTTANASLPSSALSTNIVASSANGRAVGLNTPPALFANGTVGTGGPYDGIVTMNSAQAFQFTRPPGSNYDALRTTEHEIDEVLGLGSYLPNGGNLRPQDLFSWSAPGTRNITSSGSRYFSINGGSTNIVGLNQNSNGDFGDWLSGSCPQTTPYVQNAFSCAGQMSDVTATSPEGVNLDVVGYDLTTTTQTISVTVQTSPSGRSFTVDGTAYSTAQTFTWTPGSSHTIATTSPQSGATGTQYVWGSWSDGGAISHNVSPTSNTTYTANFATQYFLTMSAGSGGTVSPASGWVNSGASVSISATPNAGFTFNGWSGTGTGSYTGTNNPATLTMNGPITEAASFIQTTNISGLQYYPLAHPVRLLDTRPGQPACFTPGAPLSANVARTQAAVGTCDGLVIPSTAKAVVGNVAVVNTLSGSTAGNLSVYPNGVTRPLTANVNYVAGQVISNGFNVALGSDGAFNIYAVSSLHVVVDITGYYAPPGQGGLYYHALPHPVRLLDTRIGESACDAPGAPLQASVARTELARTTCSGVVIPSDAKAIVGNVAVVNTLPGSTAGNLSVYPNGVTRPLTANVNYVAGQVISNGFNVALGSDGAFNIYAVSSLHVVVDITGYFNGSASADANGVTGFLFYPLPTPMRLLDTRPGQPACTTPGVPLAANTALTQAARVTCGGNTVPAAAQAVVGNVAVVNTLSGSTAGNLSMYPNGVTRPLTANVNYVAGQVISNGFNVALGSDGAFNLYAVTSLDVVVDLSGYFAP